jgi:hypothetical protein
MLSATHLAAAPGIGEPASCADGVTLRPRRVDDEVASSARPQRSCFSSAVLGDGRVGRTCRASSSYGLLTGARSRSPGLALAEEGARYREALTGRADKVIWGLPEEYATVVAAVLSDELQPVLVSQAAHGEVGSSQYVFAGLTRLLCRLLAGGLPPAEEDVWRLRDRCWGER